MKLKQWGAAVTAAGILAAYCTLVCPAPGQRAAAAETVMFSGLTGLPFANGDPFKGVDVSSVISLEQSGVKFFDRSGKEQDLFVTLHDAGVNTVRVRVWNDPYNSATRANYGGGICDQNVAVQIAERCAAADLKLLVDFHYSDFWADPGKQNAPKAWKNYTVDQKAQAIYDFTYDTLTKIGRTGADIAMVQVGNETTSGMCGVMLSDYDWSDAGWNALASLFNAGSRAVRAYSRDTLVAVHFTNPEKTSNMSYLAKMLKQTNVDYDVFATSYYPYWHGTLSNLTSVLTSVSQTYGKKVMVAETSWVRTFDDADGYRNTIGSADDLGEYVSYPVGVEGQISFLHDLFTAVSAVPDGKGIGVFYWEPAWLPVGSSWASNRALWETYGSGWANAAAGEFDSSAAEFYGGSCVENESLFSAAGVPLDSLYVFGTVHGTGGGTAEHGDNLLKNPGFEADGGWSASPSGWTLRATADGHFDVRAEDSRSGSYALHWYSEGAFSGSTAAASVKVNEAGTYRCAIHIQGDESSSYTLTVKTSGGKSETVSGSASGWSAWTQPYVDIALNAGETVTLTLTVSGGAGSYGSVDDCLVEKVTVTQPETPQVHFDQENVTLHLHGRGTLIPDRSDAELISSNPSVVTVNARGELVAVGEGTARITAMIGGREAGFADVTVLGPKPGDLTRDGESDLLDARLLRQYLLGENVLDSEQGALADLDGNGRINAVDFTLLKRRCWDH